MKERGPRRDEEAPAPCPFYPACTRTAALLLRANQQKPYSSRQQRERTPKRASLQEATGAAMSDATANSTTVYKQVSDDMRQGLRRIYQEIVSASGDGKNPNGTGHDELFTEASVQLNEIMEATEKATMRIMELVEAQLDCQMESAQLLSSIKSGQPCSAQLARLTYINNKLGEDLTESSRPCPSRT